MCFGIVKRLMTRWGRETEGTTAIEFSLLAIPYVFISIGIIELSLMYATATLLEGAVNGAARMIRTGQLQQSMSVDPAQVFRDEVCRRTVSIIPCGDIEIEALTMGTFGDYDSMLPQYDANGDMQSQGFNIGDSNDRVLVRASFRYSMMTPFVGPLLAGSSNSFLFMSTIVLQTEPYEFEGAV